MYSIFSTKSRKQKYLEEGEPPPKKLVTEGDSLIKDLARNQQETNISLSEHLNQKKEFVRSEKLTAITGCVGGESDLKEFQSRLAELDELSKLERKGLSGADIRLYRDYLESPSKFWLKHKDVNRDMLQQRLHEILQDVDKETDSDICGIPSTSRHQEDYLNSLKPESMETKLLKFAAQNNLNKSPQRPSPMDEVPALEKQMIYNIQEFSKCDLKRIRKKARSLGNKINQLTGSIMNPKEKQETLHRETLWDVKEKPGQAEPIQIVDKDKIYTCKPLNWYTIEDGRIVKLNKDKTVPDRPNDNDKVKLTLEEIRGIPKFSNYEPGIPSKTIFLKNLGKRVCEDVLINLLGNFQPGSYTVKVTNGRMKGQAFVEFQDENQAVEGLNILNGVLLYNKPIIAQFGKRKMVDK